MDQLNHHDYYVVRARSARELARRAASPAIAAIHSKMASQYEVTAAEMEQEIDRVNMGVQTA